MSGNASDPANTQRPAATTAPEPSAAAVSNREIEELSSVGRTMAIASEVAMVALWTVAADLLIFRGGGFFAVAIFFGIAAISLLVVHRFRDASFYEQKQLVFERGGDRRISVAVAGGLLVLAIVRLGWAGSVSLSLIAMLLFVSLVLSLSGWLPTLLAVLTATLFSPFFGADRLPHLQRLGESKRIGPSATTSMAVLFPAVAVLLFGGIFVLANPDLVEQVSDWLRRFSGKVLDFFSDVSFWELPFCVLAFFVGAGLLRPLVPGADQWMMRLLNGFSNEKPELPNSSGPPSQSAAQIESPWYVPFRNTLLSLIALFAAYLVFEFKTLWGREFPEGFYYAGYAHEGAAWLTVALGLATLTLSLIFHAGMLGDPRVERLKTLAWVWSGMNLLLAMAVYHRLWIYVGYNGMTRMRMVGFFGITLVLVGFVLVIQKILRQRSFAWLIESQLVALSIAVVLYCLFPVDYISHQYNANRVSGGYLKPSVMIAVKPIDDEGVFALLDLVDHENDLIREGVRAMLAERQAEIEAYSRDEPWHWHRYQSSKTRLYQRLAPQKLKWASYLDDPDSRSSAKSDFIDYAMQWY